MTPLHTSTGSTSLLGTESMPAAPAACLERRAPGARPLANSNLRSHPGSKFAIIRPAGSDRPAVPAAHTAAGWAAGTLLPGPTSAACAGTDLNWVPDRELPLVPDAMAALCTGCPGRARCLSWALGTDAQGYWAGTTTAQREQLRHGGDVDLAAADRVAATARGRELGGALHPAGEGTWWWYRNRGCRCLECRQCNAGRRSAERERARARHAQAA